QAQVVLQRNRLCKLRERLLVDDRGAHLGKMTFTGIGKGLEQNVRNNDVENRIAQELKSLVVSQGNGFVLKELVTERSMSQGLKQNPAITKDVAQSLLE